MTSLDTLPPQPARSVESHTLDPTLISAPVVTGSGGELFAAMHKIDYKKQRSASLKRVYLQPAALTRKVINATNSNITETLPIKGVYEASVAASVIRSSPGRMDTMRHLASRLGNRSE